MKLQIPTTADVVHNGRQICGHVIDVDGAFCTEQDAKRLIDLGKAIEVDDSLPATITFDVPTATAASAPTAGAPSASTTKGR